MSSLLQEDIDILAKTLYGEAEAGNVNDARAVAAVIMNRVELRNWPDDVSEVCLQPWQFSCWNNNDPGRARIAKVRPSDPWFRTCKEIAEQAVRGAIIDPTKRSTHYYATYVPKPKWVKKGNKKPVYAVAHKNGHSHLFFNDIDTKPPRSPKEALDQVRPLATTKTGVSTAVAGTAVGLGTAVEVIEKITPAIPVIDTLAMYAPWVLVAILSAIILYLFWARIDARKRGVR